MKKRFESFIAAVFFLAAAGRIPAQPVMSVKITSPENGARFAKCSNILITVDPQIQGGEIKNVALLRNNAGVTAKIKAPWEFKLSNYPSGFYVFQARLTAKTSEVVYSDPVTVYVGDGLKGNVLMNGEFECSAAPWTLNVQGGASATFSIDTSAGISNGAAAVIAVENGGSADWHVQLQQPFPIDSGHTYILFFTAQTDQNSMPISAMVQMNKDPWSVYSSGMSATVEALQDYGPFTFESTVTDHDAWIRFNIGNFSNSIIWLDAIQVYDMNLTGLKDRKPLDAGEVPDRCLISRNYPNPFNPATTIQYLLPDRAEVTLTVFNLRGQAVATLVEENQEPGDHLTSWNGESAHGERVPSGVYVYRLQAKAPDRTYTISRKIMMLE